MCMLCVSVYEHSSHVDVREYPWVFVGPHLLPFEREGFVLFAIVYIDQASRLGAANSSPMSTSHLTAEELRLYLSAALCELWT